MNRTKTSRYISLILRHQPEVIGITLDEHGWADADALIEGINRTHPLNREILEEIVRTDEKQRYSFNEDHTKIRANQGHSIPVDVELKQCEPPEILYHGTGEKYVSSILQEGLIPKSRLYVHLSKDEETAKKVGSRHGKCVIFALEAGEMHRQGYAFYLSANGVWLTKHVPAEYLHRLTLYTVSSVHSLLRQCILNKKEFCMTDLNSVMTMEPEDFFSFVKSVRYGYRDVSGRLRFADEEDFCVQDYSFSSPEDVVNNSCGWCWDVAELIRLYCRKHEIVHRSFFMEYLSDDLHQTHTQVFLRMQGKWSAAPDNSLPLVFGTPAYDDFQECLDRFTEMFTDYLQAVLKEKYDPAYLLVREYTCSFEAGISDEEYLRRILQ